MCNGKTSSGALGQLRPDVAPVVRTEIAAGYGAFGDALNFYASHWRNWSSSRGHLRKERN